jgi:hypothetical protein
MWMDQMTMQHNNSDLLSTLFVSTAERTGAVVSAAMISSPLWLPSLKVVSDAAEIIAPILGCIYLSLQIGFKLWDRARNKD